MASILSIANIYNSEPMRQNRWVLEFEDLPIHPFDRILNNGLRDTSPDTKNLTGLNKTKNIPQEDRAKYLEFSLASASRPSIQTDGQEFIRGNKKFYMPSGRWTFEELAVVFNDNIKFRPGKIMYDWCSATRNNINSAVGYKYNFSTDGYLKLLDPKGQVVEQWHLEKMWPKQINFGTLDYAQTDAVQVQVNFRYDNATLQIDNIWDDVRNVDNERMFASDPYGIPEDSFTHIDDENTRR